MLQYNDIDSSSDGTVGTPCCGVGSKYPLMYVISDLANVLALDLLAAIAQVDVAECNALTSFTVIHQKLREFRES